MNRKWKIGLLCGMFVAIIVVIGLCFWTVDKDPDDTVVTETVTPQLDLPESEYDVYCVLTESPIRYTNDGQNYEIDTFSFDQNKEMTLMIDKEGIIPLEGRVYRVFVPKEGDLAATFAVPITSGGADKIDLTRKVVAYRDSDWLYTGNRALKYQLTEESTIYYTQVMDNYLRRVDAKTVESLANFNEECPNHDNHAHTNGCFRYNAYIKFDGGFLNNYRVVWTALTVDGNSMYYYLGTEEDTQKAILPGQESTTEKLVVTTSDMSSNKAIEVKDLTGKVYTCKVNAEGVQPVGGRFYRIDKLEDGTVKFSVASRTGNNYDYYSAPVMSVNSEIAQFAPTLTKKITDETQKLRATTFWTGWMSIESVNGSDISLAQRTNTCKKSESHEHKKSCYYYNAYYKTDGYNGIDWIMTSDTGYSLFNAIGGENDVKWGSGDPKNTALVTTVDEKNVTFMDMNGQEYTCTYSAEKELPVYEGALYHVEWKNNTAVVFTKINSSVTTPGFDCTRQPLCKIDGNTLVFGTGNSEKVAQLTSDTKIFYMAAGDKRLIPMTSGELQVAHRTNTCLTKEEHEHTNDCYFFNTIFGCDGQGNLKWIICSAKNGSLAGTYGNEKNLVKAYNAATETCFTLSAVRNDGKIEILHMDGTRAAYEVHPDGFTPAKGRIYACELKDGKMLFSKPNAGAKHFTRSAVVELEEGYVTFSDRQTFRLTEDTKIFSIEKSNDKFVLMDEEKIGISLATDYCKGLPEGHEHVWNKCYNNNVLYATDAAGNLVWILVRPDGNYISTSYIGDTTEEDVKAGSASNVLFTTSNIILKDGKMWIKGIDMTGKSIEGELATDSLMPLKGSMYHMEVKDGKLCLTNPNTDYNVMGYDFGRRPLYNYEDDTVELLTGLKYKVTSETKIFNVVLENNVLTLTEGTKLPEADCHCTKEHKHVNDCYNYNMYFAADDSDELTWIMTAPADTGMFSMSGLVATNHSDSGEAKTVAVTTSHTYPLWENGEKAAYVDIIKMNGATDTVKVDENGLLPVQGKGYHITYNEDNTVTFTIAKTCEVPSSSNKGYDFARYQAAMADDNHVVLRNGRLLTVTEDTKMYQAKVEDNRITLTESDTIVASNAWSTCLGEDHSHVSGCFPYTIWYACDANGNLKWIISQETGKTSIYGALASENDADITVPTFENSPVAFVTKAPYESNGKTVVDLKDIFGIVYTAVEVSADCDIYIRAGMPYKVTMSDNVVNFEKLTSSHKSHDKAVSYSNGIMTGDSNRSYKITKDTHICYVVKNADNTLTVLDAGDSRIPANGFPANPSGYNVIQSLNMGKTSSGGYVQWMMVEVNGVSMYSSSFNAWYDLETETRTASEIMLMTSDISWDGYEQEYVIEAVDMTGTTRTLIYTENQSGIIPVKGKIFIVTENNGVTNFAWSNSVIKAVSRDGNTYCDILRATVNGYDASTKKITLRDSSKTYTLASDIKILGTKQYEDQTNLPKSHFTEYIGVQSTITTITSNDNTNALFGLNDKGEVCWILNTTDKTSMYSSFGSSKYIAPTLPEKITKNTRRATEIMLMTSELEWDAAQQKYLINAVDMTGTEKVLEYTYVTDDATNSSGIIPVKGKVFTITTENGITKFNWPKVIGAANIVENEFYDIIWAIPRNYDKATKTITLTTNKSYTLNNDAVILNVSRFATNANSFVNYTGIKDSVYYSSSSWNYNTLLGFDTEGNIAWILNNNGLGAITNVVNNNNYTAPNLEALKNR